MRGYGEAASSLHQSHMQLHARLKYTLRTVIEILAERWLGTKLMQSDYYTSDEIYPGGLLGRMMKSV